MNLDIERIELIVFNVDFNIAERENFAAIEHRWKNKKNYGKAWERVDEKSTVSSASCNIYHVYMDRVDIIDRLIGGNTIYVISRLA